MKNLTDILCGSLSKGGRLWNINMQGGAYWGKSFHFWKNGTISGTYHGDMYTPRQAVNGYWTLNGDNLIITYTYGMALSNSFGFGAQSIPSQDQMNIKVQEFNDHRIVGIQFVSPGRVYTWVFSN